MGGMQVLWRPDTTSERTLRASRVQAAGEYSFLVEYSSLSRHTTSQSIGGGRYFDIAL